MLRIPTTEIVTTIIIEIMILQVLLHFFYTNILTVLFNNYSQFCF